MIGSFITGRLTKHPELIRDRYHASLAGIDGDRSVRLICRRKHADQLQQMPLGAPVAVAGLLSVTPVLNDKGEPRAYLRMEVTAILDVPRPAGLLGKVLRR